MSENIIEVKNISKTYHIDCEHNDVLYDMSLSIKSGEFLCVLGYTGCGKSTLLRVLAGFEKADTGQVFVKGQRHTKPSKDMIMIFQDYNQLFPWKTACGNIMYAIKKTGRCKKRREAKHIAHGILDEVGLRGYYNYYPHQLSGGMRQRVAVGRALAIKSQILLMDEPFASLDEVNRIKLQQLCRKLYIERKLTVVFVTHSIGEAIAIADRILVMGRCKGNILADFENTSLKSGSYEENSAIREKVLKILKSNINNY